MSLIGALLIAVVVIVRALALHRLPKMTFLILWGLVLVRLLIPFSPPSQTSVLNLWHLLETEQRVEPASVAANIVDTLFALPNQILQNDGNDLATPDVGVAAGAEVTVDVTERNRFDALIISPLMLFWLIGAIGSAAFFAVMHVKYRRRFMASLPIENDFIKDWLLQHRLKRRFCVRSSDQIAVPLTYGILRPVILLPKDTDWTNESELHFVLAHEFVHIQRFDALIKIVATVALCIHWFNPFVWVMYFLLNRDMEISCDEVVVKRFGQASKNSYALALISMVERKSQRPVLYSNFSKYAIEERIDMIMKMKKRTLKKTLTATALVIMAAVMLITIPLGAFAGTAYPFVDVPESHWAYGYVQFANERDIMIGTSATTFAPETNLSRAMSIAIIFRASNFRVANELDVRQTPFVDVPEGAWFAPYIAWAFRSDMLTEENTFMPDDDSTREHFVTLLYRLAAAQRLNVSVPESFNLYHFTDHAEISPWALEAMRWANYNGVIRGVTDTTIAPSGTSTRAQGAAMLYRFMNETFTEEDLPPQGLNFTVCSSLYEPFPNYGHVLYLRTFGTNLESSQPLVMRYVEYQRVSLDEITAMLEAFVEAMVEEIGDRNQVEAWLRPGIEESLEAIRSGAANAYLFEFMLVDDVNGITYVQPCLRLYDARLPSFYMDDPDEVLSSIDNFLQWTIFPYHIR